MSRAVAFITYEYLNPDRDRHGNMRWYVRILGLPKIRLRAEPGSAEFDAEYRAALAKLKGVKPTEPVTREHTWRWLVEQYLRSADHKALHPSTQQQRLRVLQETWHEPRKQGAPEVIGDMPLSRMDERVIAFSEIAKLAFPKPPTSVSKPFGACSRGPRRPGLSRPTQPAMCAASTPALKATTLGPRRRSSTTKSAIRSAPRRIWR